MATPPVLQNPSIFGVSYNQHCMIDSIRRTAYIIVYTFAAKKSLNDMDLWEIYFISLLVCICYINIFFEDERVNIEMVAKWLLTGIAEKYED